MSYHFKSLGLLVQELVQAHSKENIKAPYHWPFGERPEPMCCCFTDLSQTATAVWERSIEQQHCDTTCGSRFIWVILESACWLPWICSNHDDDISLMVSIRDAPTWWLGLLFVSTLLTLPSAVKRIFSGTWTLLQITNQILPHLKFKNK